MRMEARRVPRSAGKWSGMVAMVMSPMALILSSRGTSTRNRPDPSAMSCIFPSEGPT